jgi:hypothetical protein
MKKFLIKVGLFSISIAMFCFFVYSKAGENTDAFYNRLNQPSKKNLIIGTSRAAQGLQPKVFDSILDDNEMFNYAFTIGHSPYGPTYLKSIQKKLKANTSNGTFIIAVDPWSIANDIENPNDVDLFAESDRFLGNLPFVNIHPNIPYLVNYYNNRNVELLRNKNSIYRLHDDGWLEVSPNKLKEKIKDRRDRKIKQYTEKLLFVSFSKTRLNYLSETIRYLKKHGDVYLVRLPVHTEMQGIENKLMPQFDEQLLKISTDLKVPYKSYMDESSDLIFIDGHHLFKDSGKLVSTWIAKWIKNNATSKDVK